MSDDTNPARGRFSPLRFVGYALVAGLAAGAAAWVMFRVSPEAWRAVRAPVSWLALVLVPFVLGILLVARQSAAERGWSSLLWAWCATFLFTLGMNLPSINGLRMLLAILVFVMPACSIGVAAALLAHRRAARQGL
ncbi:MAG: hypothetical protein JNN30_11585 [Rhodanobacteraceae bacterium]|nr:hypothetical protein [Rhodanobacteraceae bacterium]